jgi:hypothetical protein
VYEPFPGNYVWNLSVNLCIAMGGAIGEMERANDHVRQVAREGADAGTEAFFSAWMSMADQVVELADEAAAARHFLSAAEKYGRATAYYLTAERMQNRRYEPGKKAYRAMLKTMDRMIFAGSLNCERVEIPYGDKSFPGLFVKGHGAGPRPCVVFCNGLDSVKEMIYLSVRDELAKRACPVSWSTSLVSAKHCVSVASARSPTASDGRLRHWTISRPAKMWTIGGLE